MENKNALEVISNKEIFDGEIRTLTIEGKPFFVASDVAKALGYKKPNNAINSYCRSTLKWGIGVETGNKADGTPAIQKVEMNIIPEGDIYRLIMKSKLPKAQEFESWVCDKVLPTIRETAKALELVTYTPSDCSLVNMKNGFCYTTSDIIADSFDKQHKDVKRIIDNYFKNNEKDERNFTPISNNKLSTRDFMKQHTRKTTYIDAMNRTQEAYELDEFAFSFIALSFTGEKAERFKIKFINEFFKMRQALLERTKALAIEQVLPQDKNLRQYVYLIQNEMSGNIKIGVGQNPEQRLKQLQTGSDSDLILLYKSMVCSNAYEIESYLHHTFSNYNIRGEWFNMDKEDILKELENCEFVLNSKFNIGIL